MNDKQKAQFGTCDKCLYWEPLAGAIISTTHGMCRRNPVWHFTQADIDWCAEYKKKSGNDDD